MKKTLAIILAYVLNMENTGVMASGIPEIGGEDNTALTKALTKALENPRNVYESLSYLPLKEIGRNRFVSRNWNEWIHKSIKHLILHATRADVESFLNFPEVKIPFYYAPKNARRNMNDFFLKPSSWEMMLSLLKNKKHLVQDQQLCLEEGLGSTTQRVTPILEMFFNAEHTWEEKQEFIQNSLLNPEVITFLGKTPELMVQIKIDAETINIIMDCFHFLETLRARAPRDMYKYAKDQADIPLKALGLIFVAMNKNVRADYRIDVAKILAGLGEEYKPQAAQACLSITTDKGLDPYYRIYAAKTLALLGEEYKPQAAQICGSIATDTNVDPYHRIDAANILAGCGEEYKHQAAQIYGSIATDTNVESRYRIDAAKTLAGLGEEYKDQAAQAYGSIATDTNVESRYRIDAAKTLAGLGEEYKHQAAQAYGSIATDTNVEPWYRIKAAKILAGLGEEYKHQAAQICGSIATDTNVDSDDRIDAAKILAGLGEKYKLQAIQICRLIAMTTQENSIAMTTQENSIAMTTQEKIIRIEAEQALKAMGSF